MLETKVILLEDDRTLLQAVTAHLEKEGIEVLGTSHPEEAREFLAKHRITTLFVDCLLPSENGVDFAKSIREQFPKEILDIVLMSGVFTDPSFVREALRDSEASAFLRKPFGLEELQKHIKRVDMGGGSPHPRKLLYQLFAKPGATARERRKTIESLEEIHGFDLPLIYSLLVDSKLSGHLNIVAENGDVSGISFSEGVIVVVDVVDKETILGKLLIEAGFLMPEDLETALNQKSSNRLGDKLLQGNLLSPHGFNIALANQMSIRLSGTIVDQPVRVNFVPAETQTTSPHIDSELFQSFLHDWIASKISDEWFKAHFMQWMHARFIKTPLFIQKASALRMPLVARLEKVIETVTSGKTLGEIIEAKFYPEETLYKTLHFLLTRGLLAFEERAVLSMEERTKLMKKIMQQFANKNRLEIFDLMSRMTSTPPTRLEQVYMEFMGILGSEEGLANADAKTLHQSIAVAAKNAYEYARTGTKQKMREELMKGDVEMKLKASRFFEEAKKGLQKAQYRESLSLIQKAASLDPKLDRLHLYMSWALLGVLEPGKKGPEAFKEIDMHLMQIAPEDKFDSLYSFVIGLYSKAKGDHQGARKALEKAIAMDSTMIVARRELTVLSSMVPQKSDLFDGDLKTLVGNLFSKKR